MIRHIAMFKLTNVKDDMDRSLQIDKMKSTFSPLRNTINVVESYEIGVNVKRTAFSYDLIIISEFNTLEKLEIYLNHPEHQKAIQICQDIKKEKAVIDYEF